MIAIRESMLVGRTSAELRACWLWWRFLPIARVLFGAQPTARSFMAGFARFWNDEADDAVHEFFAVSEHEDPGWISGRVEPSWSWGFMDFPALGSAPFLSHGCDDDRSLIVAFASCCERSSRGDFDHPDPTPWAIARRPDAGEDPLLEIVGLVHRPEWEDRWEVGFEAGTTTGLEARLAVSAAARLRLERADPAPEQLLRRAVELAGRLPASPASRHAGPEAVIERRLASILERAASLRREIASS